MNIKYLLIIILGNNITSYVHDTTNPYALFTKNRIRIDQKLVKALIQSLHDYEWFEIVY